MRTLGPTTAGSALVLLLHIAPVHAQATRTWVSRVGSDAAGQIMLSSPAASIAIADVYDFVAQLNYYYQITIIP